MIKNRTAQLIFQSFYCAIGLIGIFASFGIFDDFANPRLDFYAHFTNISNYFCIGIVLSGLIKTAKSKKDEYITHAPLLTFIGVLSILLTFLVFNILLAGAADRRSSGKLAYCQHFLPCNSSHNVCFILGALYQAQKH